MDLTLPECAPYEAMTALLREKFGEVRYLAAPNSAGLLFELHYNEETGTWTALLVAPLSRRTCVVMTGKGLVSFDAPGRPL